jgi:hypothetical protein
MKSSVLGGLLSFVVAFAVVSVAFAGKIDFEKLKCVVNADAAAKEDKASDYKDCKVYFCCGNCQKKFDGDKKGYAAKANHQLVATKQVEQKGCPFSGNDLKKDATIEFKGATIGFCCNDCKGKAEKYSDDDKLSKLFGDDPYEKAKFKKTETK